MAFTVLKTDYANDVLDTGSNANVKYTVTTNADSTISLTDATVYTTLGDSLDASVVNSTNAVVNAIGNQVVLNQGDIATNALAISAAQDDIDDLLAGKVDLDTTAAVGTTDGDLYAALTALGWQTDVIE